MQESGKARTMSEQSSPTSPTVLAFFDRESSSWRTSQGSLLSAAPESLARLPAWGTTSGGVLYELQTPERLTAARDGSASLPTPNAAAANGESGTDRDWGGDLTFAVSVLPTPVVNDMGAGKTIEDWDSWTDEMKARHGNGNGHGPSLSIEVARLEFMAKPSPDGSESSDEKHPNLSIIDNHNGDLFGPPSSPG